MNEKLPLCTVCKKNWVPKHQLPAKPFPAICDSCLRANLSRPK